MNFIKRDVIDEALKEIENKPANRKVFGYEVGRVASRHGIIYAELAEAVIKELKADKGAWTTFYRDNFFSFDDLSFDQGGWEIYSEDIVIPYSKVGISYEFNKGHQEMMITDKFTTYYGTQWFFSYDAGTNIQHLKKNISLDLGSHYPDRIEVKGNSFQVRKDLHIFVGRYAAKTSSKITGGVSNAE